MMSAQLEVVNLKKYFPIRRGLRQFFRGEKLRYVKAVDDVSFKIDSGESAGLVGESGSGKTTLARLILRLLDATDGKIVFEGRDIQYLKGKELKEMRRKMQIIFQDPYASLNPRKTVLKAIEEPLLIHKLYDPAERKEVVQKILRSVGMTPPEIYLDKYPYQLSGGQRQRVAICRALVLNPTFVVMDEPVSLLDATVRTQIINLIFDLKKEYNLTYLFITHDIALTRYLCERILVMYQGKIVEGGPTEEAIQNPLHPYTRMLISAVPVPNPHIKISLPPKVGEIDSSVVAVQGCKFYLRCPAATPACQEKEPPLEEVEDGRMIACFNYKK